MSEMEKPAVGTVVWADLTVENAGMIRDFYSEVVGWQSSPVSMGDYDDFNMMMPGSEMPAAGICHARALNAELPPVWMMYIVVADLKASMASCVEQGGRVLLSPDQIGENVHYCVIQDPAGAVVALYEAE